MKNIAKSISGVPVIMLIAVLSLTWSCQQPKAADEQLPAGQTVAVKQEAPVSGEALIARGAYLVTIMGCDDCHTPKKMTENGPVFDLDRRLMGYPADQPLPKLDPAMVGPGQWVAFGPELTAAIGPWGASFAGNLTPDGTGIGFWKEENFIKAIREGKLKGMDNGRPILPPMPWQNFAKASDEDLRAIFAFLKSIKPIQNVVPQPIPPDQLSALQ